MSAGEDDGTLRDVRRHLEDAGHLLDCVLEEPAGADGPSTIAPEPSAGDEDRPMTAETKDERPCTRDEMLAIVELHRDKLRTTLTALEALEDEHDPGLLRLAAERVREAVVDLGPIEETASSMPSDLADFWSGGGTGGWFYRALLSLPLLALALERAAEEPAAEVPGQHGRPKPRASVAVSGLWDHVYVIAEWVKTRTYRLEEPTAYGD